MNDEDERIRLEIIRLSAEKDLHAMGLIPLLQEIQGHFGYLPRQAMIEVARLKGVPHTHVYSVASFYNQFRFVPPGKYPIQVCLGTACHIKGGEAILKVWEKKLGIEEGQVTQDRLFSLERVACVGCCALAPVTVIGETIEAHMIPTRVEGILLGITLDGKNQGTQEKDRNPDAKQREDR